MAEGLWVAITIVALVLIYVVGKVITYARKSEQQWQQTDKSKLKEWVDDDDW